MFNWFYGLLEDQTIYNGGSDFQNSLDPDTVFNTWIQNPDSKHKGRECIYY